MQIRWRDMSTHCLCHIQDIPLAVFSVYSASLLHTLATWKLHGALELNLLSFEYTPLHVLFPWPGTLSPPSLFTTNFYSTFRIELGYYSSVTPLLTPLDQSVDFLYVLTKHPNFRYQGLVTLYWNCQLTCLNFQQMKSSLIKSLSHSESYPCLLAMIFESMLLRLQCDGDALTLFVQKRDIWSNNNKNNNNATIRYPSAPGIALSAFMHYLI